MYTPCVLILACSETYLQYWLVLNPKATTQAKETTNHNQTEIINKIRPKLLNLAFCLIIYSSDVFLALADRNSSILSWKSELRGTSSWVRDLVSLSFCSMASWTWLARTGMVRRRDVLGTRSSFGRGKPAIGGLCVNFELNIFIFSLSDILAGSSSSNLAATSECVRIYITLCSLCLYPGHTQSRGHAKKKHKPTIKRQEAYCFVYHYRNNAIYMLLIWLQVVCNNWKVINANEFFKQLTQTKIGRR